MILISAPTLLIVGLLVLIYSGVTKRGPLVLPLEITGLVLCVLALVFAVVR